METQRSLVAIKPSMPASGGLHWQASVRSGISLRALVGSWRYEGGKRDLRLDVIRGFAAFAMIADHIGGAPSWLYLITGGNEFAVSAAEPFVFLSGLTMGIVYAGVIRRSGIRAGVAKALRRAWTLYVLTVFLTFAFAALGGALNFWWAPDLSNGGILGFVVGVVTLHRTLFLTDIPLMYTFMLLAAVPALVLLHRRHALLLLGLSWSLWGLWQLSPGAPNFPWHVQGNVVFFFPAWQVLFITPLVIGYHRDTIERAMARVPRRVLMAGLELG